MKIFIQRHNDRFINNIYDTLVRMDHEVEQSDVNKDIYKIYHKYPFNIAIFIASKFSQDIAQFVSEFYNGKNPIKFIIYHDVLNEQIIQDYGGIVTNLSKDKKNNTITIPRLLNENIFRNTKTSRNKGTYVVFLEHSKVLPEDLTKELYPASKKKIKMFNSPYIQHYQNIGLLSEQDKADILNSNEFFINIDNQYTDEAIACGAKIVDMSDINKENTKQKKNTNVISYENFIGLHII